MNFIPKLDGVITEKVFSKDEVKKILDTEAINKKDGLIYSPKEKKFVQNKNIRKAITYDLVGNIDWIKNKILEHVGKINKEHWKFNLSGMLENPTLMKYEKGCFYNWHIDIGEGNGGYDIFSMRKISYSILLNDDYEGGGLEIRARPFNEVSSEPGTGSFFPSYILHKVDSVISGTRFALVGWVHGQPFS